MPVFEMPLAELRRYQGRNPKPVDFGHEGLPGWNDRLFEFFSEL